MERNLPIDHKRTQIVRAWMILLLTCIPWLLLLKDGLNPVFRFASGPALCFAYLLGMGYYALLSVATLWLLPTFKAQWTARNRGIGSLVGLSALMAIIPTWTFPTAITQLAGQSETMEVKVFGKSSGRLQRHTCDYSVDLFPFEGRVTNVCVSKIQWANAPVGERVIVNGKRSAFGYVVSSIEAEALNSMSRSTQQEPQDRDSRQPGPPSTEYADRVRSAVGSHFTGGNKNSTSMDTVIEVSCAHSGTILSASIVESSGDAQWDDAALRAVRMTNPMPLDVNGTIPGKFRITLRPTR